MNMKQSGFHPRGERRHRLVSSGSRSRTRVLSVAFAMLVVAALVPSAASALTAPASDPFYVQPANIAHYPHGTIVRERQVTLSGPTQTQAAAAYQLMYATTDATGRPVAAVTTVMVPSSPAAGPRRLASYQTYYDSLTLNCAPSYTLQGGNSGGGTNGPTEQTMMSEELGQGWDVVTSDYEGLNSEWAVGPMLGHATLDSIIAAEHFTLAGLEGAKTEVTLNGYSGGSEASTWAATPPRTLTTRSGTAPRSAFWRASAARCRRTST
jgi:secretory lipase